MNSPEFLRIIDEAYAPFLREMGFVAEAPSTSGRSYRADFSATRHRVSVSFEPGEDAIFVLVFSREDGRWSDVDDRLRTPRLSDLNARYMNTMSLEERSENEAVFAYVVTNDDEERRLLEHAKQLRLVLPKYLATHEPAEPGET